MPIAINGSGTITGISAGGLPDGVITADDIEAGAITDAKLAANSVTSAKIADGAIVNADINASAAITDSKLTGTTCKAWVNFNGTGTVAIRASYNVSSITDNNTGDYTINFTTALADANFSAAYITGSYLGGNVMSTEAYTASSVRVVSYTYSGGSAVDKTYNNVAIFR